MKCTSCGRGNVFFGDTCSYCGTTNRDNTQSLDQFYNRFKPNRQKRRERDDYDEREKSFFRPAWAIPFKMLWLPVRLVWWLVKIPL